MRRTGAMGMRESAGEAGSGAARGRVVRGSRTELALFVGAQIALFVLLGMVGVLLRAG